MPVESFTHDKVSWLPYFFSWSSENVQARRIQRSILLFKQWNNFKNKMHLEQVYKMVFLESVQYSWARQLRQEPLN